MAAAREADARRRDPGDADANSMTYVLHKKLGDDIVLPRGDREIRLRLVAARATASSRASC